MNKYLRITLISALLIFSTVIFAGCGQDTKFVGKWIGYSQEEGPVITQITIEQNGNGYTIKKKWGAYRLSKGNLFGNGNEEFSWNDHPEEISKGTITKDGKLIVNGNEQDFYRIDKDGLLLYSNKILQVDTGKEFSEMKKKAADEVIAKEKKDNPKRQVTITN